ncbi:M23 family metallopeptidase [Leucobacter chromiireducens]|uniref:M23 family metallopeptidase n=1 Tax=Leucobacter chromiireducens TaxID=283877 RepID=UPI000F62C814|nr:M23 family metallopeptidase [Leucobacter chromiireducens]
MSAPAAFACAAAALCLGLPVLAAANHLEAQHRAAAVADAAALAAADATSGWVAATPCELAEAVAHAQGGGLVRCDVETGLGEARVEVELAARLGTVTGRARAAPPGPQREEGSSAWVWPAAGRGVTQGLHDGFAIDLDVPLGGALLAPRAGTVVAAGPDGGPVPAACRAQPEWWRGPNVTVIIRHDDAGQPRYSSHNHVAPGSSAELGIAPGSRVRAGQAVARAGMSGCTSGPHSHFTIASTQRNAYPDINPFELLGGGE